MVKLSFIVPIYNVKDYLRKCVDSLLAQDYDNYEIILVDDGSTDGSGELADQIAEELSLSLSSSFGSRCDCRCRTLHQANRGLSAARNAGIELASGEYICFVDSDDYWEENVLSGLMAQIERDKLDVLRFRYQNVNPNYEIFNPYKSNQFKYDDFSSDVTDGIDFLNHRMGAQCYAVMYIIRRTLLEDCRFTEKIYFEDTDWTPRMLMKAKRIASTSAVVYNYLVRVGSITQAVDKEKKRKILEDKMRLLTTLKERREKLREEGMDNRWYEGMIASTVVSVAGLLAGEFYDERIPYIQRIARLELVPLSTYLANSSVKRKIRLLNINYRLAVKLLRISYLQKKI